MHLTNNLRSILFPLLFTVFAAGCALILASLIVAESYRYAFVFIVIPACIIVFQKQLHRKNIAILLVVVAFFPIPLNISTTNLGPISQYLILATFSIFFIGYLIGKTDIVFTKNLLPLLAILLLFGAISTISTWGNHDIFRTSFWSLVMLLSCCSFLLLLDSLEFDDFPEKKKFFLRLMDIIILLLCLQIVLGTIVYFFPQTGKYFSIFYSKNSTSYLAAAVVDGNIARLRTVVFTPEGLGEIIAMVLPYALYRLSTNRSLIFLMCCIVLGCGMMLSVTRSGIVLSCAAVAFYLVFIEKSVRMRFTVATAFLMVTGIVISFDLGTSAVIQRFSSAFDQYAAGGDALTISNRGFFRENFQFFLDRLSIFGNGLVSPLYYKILSFDFHNLYLTIFFQYGLGGGLFYFLLPFLLARKIWQNLRSGRDEKLDKIMLLSMGIFFINEFKFEFTRNLNGVLIIWMIFSLYFLFSKDHFTSQTNNAEDLQHQQLSNT